MPASLTIQYLGQEGICLRDARRCVVIDPYLSYAVDQLAGFPPKFWTRNYPPPVRPAELRDVDLVLCSHDHLDHADPETLLGIAAASPRCRFAGPRPTVALMRTIGLAPERLIELNAEARFDWNGLTIDPIAAAHETYETDEHGWHRFLGFLLRWDGATLYHAGDTVLTPELPKRLSRERIDIAFVPVNGADDARRRLGIVGNMDVAAAAVLAAEQRFGLLVPLHYDLYPNNGLSADAFAAAWVGQPAAARVRLKVFQPGECLPWSPG